MHSAAYFSCSQFSVASWYVCVNCTPCKQIALHEQRRTVMDTDRNLICWIIVQVRPYHCESTTSRQICQVKRSWACSVLGWGTAWEQQVSYFCFKIFAIINCECCTSPLYLARLPLSFNTTHIHWDTLTVLTYFYHTRKIRESPQVGL